RWRRIQDRGARPSLRNARPAGEDRWSEDYNGGAKPRKTTIAGKPPTTPRKARSTACAPACLRRDGRIDADIRLARPSPGYACSSLWPCSRVVWNPTLVQRSIVTCRLYLLLAR